MRPIKLSVRAFGPYAGDQVFDFGALEGRSFFLIHGPTGAGKTSILDAVCFALYGQASGNREARQMRSDHARPETLTEVTFDFSIGADGYRITRSPEQERPKKKGAGTVMEKPAATLWKRAGLLGGGALRGGVSTPGSLQGQTRMSAPPRGEGVNGEYAVLEEGWAKVNERVERLLGFRVDQFRQVVMLPQGMFQKLLMSSSKEREEILEALFAVEQYGRIEAALKESAAKMKRERETATQLFAETLRAAGAEGKAQLVERRAGVEALRTAAAVAVEQMREGRKAAADALAAGRAVAEKLAERDRAAAAVAALESRREAIALRQAAHERACKAAALVQSEEEVVRRQQEAKRAADKLEGAKKSAAAATATKAAADAALATETAREPEREAARERVVRLDGLAEKAKELTGAIAAVTAARKAQADAHAARADAEKSAGAARAAVEAAEKRRGDLEKAFAQLDAITARHNATKIELNTRRDLESQRALRATTATTVDRVAAAAKRAAQTLAWGRETLADLQARWNRGQAALLARSLAPGQPCPVCGSLEHPAPAHAAEDLPSEDKLKAAAEQVDRLTAEHTKLVADLAKHEAELAGVASQIARLEDGMGLRIAADVQTLEREAKDWEAKRQAAESAGIDLSAAAQGVVQAKAQEAATVARMSAADAALSTAAAGLSAADAVLAERQAAVPENLRSPGAVERERDVAAKRRKAIEDALTAARKAAEAAAAALATASAELAGAAELAETTKALFEHLRQQFSEKAKAAGFEDHAAFRAAKLTDEQIAAVDAEVRDYHVAVGAARERAERGRAAAGELATPDLPGLTVADAAAQRSLEAKINEAAELSQRLSSVDAALARLTELEGRLVELDARYKVVGAIADAANGNNDYNMTFQRYVLGVFLDEVLYAATQRLRTMSKGRFLLQRVTETASGNRSGGLDLQVSDTHTSSVRPVSTLSGGESFLASLSLALGLADVVQSYAGGIRLETIFVDEGFGTLDPESLDLAIRALRDLQKGGRLVGIISHVTELREWIDARLEVVPGRGGSEARFVVG